MTRCIGASMPVVLLGLVLAACTGPNSPDPTATPPPTVTPTITPSPTAISSPTPSPTSTPSPTPTPTPTPTPFIPPTIAVEDDDSVEACLERNITPELLISLQMDDTELTEDILRECLETQVPSELVFLLGPLIDDAADCTLETSKTLTTQELIDLAGSNDSRKSAIVSTVVDDILACIADEYGLDFLT